MYYDAWYWRRPKYRVRRQDLLEENIAFLWRNVQFIGLNLVGGFVYDADRWQARLEANLHWMNENVDKNMDKIDLVIVFGHSEPDEDNEYFFTKWVEDVKRWRKSVLYVHLASDAPMVQRVVDRMSFPSGISFLGVQGGVWPPTKIEVSTQEREISVYHNDWLDP